MSFPATYGDALYARHVLREARRGKSPLVDRKLADRALLESIIRCAFASGLVQLRPPFPTEGALEYRGACRSCGCTDENCQRCVELTGVPCHWIERGLCSACGPMELTRAGIAELARLEKKLRA